MSTLQATGTTDVLSGLARRARAGGDEARVLRLALITYAAVFAVKLGAYFLTGVMALFAEVLHTLGDIFVTGFLLAAVLWSRKPPDELHMFGYARAQPAAALVAATLFVSFTAYQLYEEAIPRLFSGDEASYDTVGIAFAVLIVSMLLAAAPLADAREGRSTMDVPSTALLADMWDGNGHMGGGWWIVMMIWMVLFWGAVILGVVWLARGGVGWSRPDRRETPLEILDRRRLG